MELWQAILLGSQIRGQSYGPGLIMGGGSCAIEAANEAIGIPVNKECLLDAVKAWPLLYKSVLCPVCKLKSPMYSVIALCLNDTHKWTRERIALEFVRPLEESLEPAPVEVEMKGVKC